MPLPSRLLRRRALCEPLESRLLLTTIPTTSLLTLDSPTPISMAYIVHLTGHVTAPLTVPNTVVGLIDLVTGQSLKFVPLSGGVASFTAPNPSADNTHLATSTPMSTPDIHRSAEISQIFSPDP